MNKKIIIFLAILFLTTTVIAQPCPNGDIPRKPTFKERREFDKLINEKLNLTQEQQEILKKNRSKHIKEMEKIVDDMQKLHDKIRDIYLTGIPKFQADIKSAPMKAELVMLKQNADKLRAEHRKAFEAILTPEQKATFEQLLKEPNLNRQTRE